MINKLATSIGNNIELSFTVPSEEKQIATIAVERFNAVLNALMVADDYLDILYLPFKKTDETMQTSDIIKNRGSLNIFRSNVIQNFNVLKKRSLLALNKINYFSNDMHISNIINTFVQNVGDIEKEVNNLVELLNHYNAENFKDKVIKYIENIKQYINHTEDFINERIIDYIDLNILAKNWTSNSDSGIIIEKPLPLVQRLIEETTNNTPYINNNEQKLNPSDAISIRYPGYGKEELKDTGK